MADEVPKKAHRGVLILVLGILGIVCCLPAGIVAWVMGHSDLKAIERGEIDPEGRSLTQAGKICGIIGVIVQVLGLLFWLAWTVLFVSVAARQGG